jgi:non-heme chloroperoxidase
MTFSMGANLLSCDLWSQGDHILSPGVHRFREVGWIHRQGSKVAELSRELKLPYAEQGDAARIPVVLLHGFLDSLRSFELVLAHLPGFVHAFALTQRGHGDGSRPVSGYAIPDFAGDLTAFMDALGIERGVIVGHSLGSAVARRFATDHPERTLGLVLVGATATVRGTPEARKHWDALLAELMDPVDAGFVRDAFEGDTVQPLPPEFLDALVHRGPRFRLSCGGRHSRRAGAPRKIRMSWN